MAFVILALVVHENVNSIEDGLHVQQWEDWDGEDNSNTTVEQDHQSVLDLENKVTQSFTLGKHNWNDEWQDTDTDGEECDCDTTCKFIKTGTILKSDDVHSSDGIKILVDKLVTVDEHGNQETQQQDVENVHEHSDEDLTLWVRIVFKVLFTVEAIEDIQNNLEEGRFVHLKLLVKLSSNNDEATNEHTKSDSEFLELTDHFIDHHDEFSELGSSFQQKNHDQRVESNKGRQNQLETHFTCL